MLTRDVLMLRQKISQDIETRKAYQAWLSNPMTEAVLRILTLQGQPTLASPVDGVVAAQALGHAAGWANCLQALQHLDHQEVREEIQSTFEPETT